MTSSLRQNIKEELKQFGRYLIWAGVIVVVAVLIKVEASHLVAWVAFAFVIDNRRVNQSAKTNDNKEVV